MTQDEIIRMATEVWGYADWKGAPLERLERFAALVAEPWIETNKALAKEIIEMKKQADISALPIIIEVAVKEAVLAEREVIAEYVDRNLMSCHEYAAAIRSRSSEH
jgi:hypothetical protein